MRWQMNRLGFVNFWLYDVEEFPFRGGRLLLRGANGAGKSITTQSFIPFILDGNHRPERLDSFGTKDRKMDFYLLGDGDRDESTGYLYLEFKKPDVEHYCTLVIGMRAQKNKGISSFWGFCLCDGRRIGSDLFLYREAGSQRLPLSKQEAKNALGDPGNWADSTTDYKKLVNDRIFQFPDIDQYEQFITLLIQIRAPKLSKDFKPSLVQDILNASLQPLSDNDLQAMVDAMEKMDSIQGNLEQLERAQISAGIIRNEYIRYNQYMLAQKARAFLKHHDETENLQSHVTTLQNEIADLELQIEALNVKILNDSETLSQLKSEKNALGGSDTLQEKADRLKELRDTLEKNDRDCEQDERNVEGQREKRNQSQRTLNDLQRQKDDQQALYQQRLDELDELQEQLQWNGPSELKKQLAQKSSTAFKEAYAAGTAYSRRLKDAQTALEQQEEKSRELDDVQKRLSDAEINRRTAQKELDTAYLVEQKARDELIEAFLRAQAGNREFELSDMLIGQIKQIVSHYKSTVDDNELNTLLSDQKNALYGLLQTQLAERRTRWKELQDAYNALCAQLKALEDAPDPVPPRIAAVQETREELCRRGVSCAPFYDLIDFAPGMEQRKRDLLESQLTDMGLLDALVVPQSEQAVLSDILEQHPDHFVRISDARPRQPLRDLYAVEGPLKEAAVAALSGISCTDDDGDTAVLSDGRYRLGVLSGKSHPFQTAGFIGAAARRENRQRQIGALKKEIAECQGALGLQYMELEKVQRRIENLNAEYVGRPSTADLAMALSLVQACENNLAVAKREVEQFDNAEKDARTALGNAKQRVITLCKEIAVSRTVSAFLEEQNSLDDYMALLYDLEEGWNGYHHAEELFQAQSGMLEQAESYLVELELTARTRKNKSQTLHREIEALQDFLNQPENRALAEKLQKINGEISELEKNLPDWKADVRVDEGKLEQLREKKLQKAQELVTMIERENNLRAYFLEEQALGFFPDTVDESVLAAAHKAELKLRAQDVEQLPDNMYQALHENFLKNSAALTDYQPKIVPQFEEAEGILRRRRLILLTLDGKQVSLPFFMQEIDQKITLMQELLNEKDRELFESILTETISGKLRNRIAASHRWVRTMSEIMGGVNTSMGLLFNLSWKGRTQQADGELDTKKLVELLNRDIEILSDEDRRKITAHFRAKVSFARRLAMENDQSVSYADLIRDALDFRNWFEFTLSFQRRGEKEKNLTNSEFNKFSGGEKAMAMYVPLFAAISAQYKRASVECPYVIALDEAFAGVDDKNIESMFALVETLGFGYIMNSQALWGCYASVPQLEIADMYRPANSQVVTILLYRWDGYQKTLDEGVMLL